MGNRDDKRFWYRCAHLLMRLPPDQAIPRILRSLGRAHRADRAWLLRYNRGFTHFWNAYEWTRGDATAHVEELQGIPVEMAAWLHERLLLDQPVQISDVAQMPRRARALQAEFRRQGITSLLSVPIFHRGRLAFQIGYDATQRSESWSDPEIDQLRQVGRLLALLLLSDPTRDADPAPPVSQVHLHQASRHHSLPLEEITHITALGDYSRVHFLDGRDLSDARSLRQWESELTPVRFLRINRSTIVNLLCLESLDRKGGAWKLSLRGLASSLSVGRPFRAALRQRLDF
ncbi:DNA-binding LytR/AlgR family response regulator [Haloferula luteola]|uniref:DNA-binding LytR/AlgR family response regulator n=2 Tax=Haloferula luteola TaxID=595692 RepID=A0A840VB77_9BACT|nr:DNA-binding LytR/AlgR family response regulator [Haloferula luteola]